MTYMWGREVAEMLGDDEQQPLVPDDQRRCYGHTAGYTIEARMRDLASIL